MTKCVCLKCNAVFDEEDIASWIEYHGLEYGGERWYGSPCCYEDFVDAHECDCCGEYITTDQYIEIDENKYCWDCVMIKRLEEI